MILNKINVGTNATTDNNEILSIIALHAISWCAMIISAMLLFINIILK